MTVENPGSYNQFEVQHPEIPPHQRVAEYTGILATHRAEIIANALHDENVWDKRASK